MPGRAGEQPFDPAPRDLRMNRAVARFTSSAPTWLRVEVVAGLNCSLLDFRQDDSLLGLVFAFFVFVGDFALLV
jgi:hypothetical protein